MPDDNNKLGWPLLHSKLPPAAIHPLSKDVYGVEGLSDVNEAYLIQRLFASGLPWEWRLVEQTYLGAEDRQGRNKDYTTRYYLAAMKGELVIDGRAFHGAGASDNRKLDAAFKGAATVAFKNAAKVAGLTIELFKDGRAMDFIYEDRQGNVMASQAAAPGASDKVTTPSQESTTAIQPTPPAPSSEEVAGNATPTASQPPPQAPASVSTTPLAGPAFSRRMGVGRSVGPAPRRTNVVTVEPQAAEKPATGPEAPPQPVTSAETAASQQAPPDLTDDLAEAPAPVDDGLGPQRQLLRQAAGELAHVNAVLRNKLEHPLKNEALEPVPPITPSKASDDGLQARIDIDYPGRTLANLGAEELQSILVKFDGSLNKKRALMAEKGISESD